MEKREYLKTPVLFMCFNRPEKTEQVFDRIRQACPRKLYVAVDAPREGRQDDVENCAAVKRIVEKVDWPCETHYLYQDHNLGCTRSGITAWNWLFSHEDRMIFIEDDGLGSLDTFYFMEDLLEKYKDDERIAYIGGVDYGPKYGNATYFFSRIPGPTYFMATWKRTHEKYDYDLEGFASGEKIPDKSHYSSRIERLIYTENFRAYVRSIKQNRRHNTYDLQMNYLARYYDMISISPNVNLVSNIGYDGGANTNYGNKTNSKFYKEYAERKIIDLPEIIHPEKVEINLDFEKRYFKKRILFLKPWIQVYGKILFLEYFGTFYKKWIKPLRRR